MAKTKIPTKPSELLELALPLVERYGAYGGLCWAIGEAQETEIQKHGLRYGNKKYVELENVSWAVRQKIRALLGKHTGLQDWLRANGHIRTGWWKTLTDKQREKLRLTRVAWCKWLISYYKKKGK